MGDSTWMPQVGDWVVYRPLLGPAEDGEVTAILNDRMVRVRFRFDTVAKATYVRDLEPGVRP